MNKTITSSLVRTAYKSRNKPQYAAKPHVSWGFLVLPHTQFHPTSTLFRWTDRWTRSLAKKALATLLKRLSGYRYGM